MARTNFALMYEQIARHLETTGQEGILRTDFMSFIANNQVNRELSEQDKHVHDVIKNLLVTNHAAYKELKNTLPENLVQEKKDYLNNLRTKASRTADAHATKKQANQINAEKAAAKRELEKIRKQREINAQKELGNRNFSEKDVKENKYKDTLTAARGRHLLTSTFNSLALGTRDERRKRVAYPDGAERIEHVSQNGKIRLNGAKYVPENPNGKVVIVFSGSHGPGAEYIGGIKDSYLNKGVTVVQLDYRGFGESTNLGKNGKATHCSPSEQNMYKDGMEMYKYVHETMGIAPENIVLHGYSLGGAVASRVALEVSKQMQTERSEQGKSYNVKKGLGGVVLHSPIKSLDYAATKDSGYRLGGKLAKMFSGGYDTEKHMLELAKVDKNVPVYLTGGNPNEDEYDFDHCAPQATGLENSLNGKFNSMAAFHGDGDHLGKITERDDEGHILVDENNEPVQTDRPNLPVLDNDGGRFDSLIRFGRELNVPVQQLQHNAGPVA